MAPLPTTPPDTNVPTFLAHADWSTDPAKRWMCVAEETHRRRYVVSAPEPVGETATLLDRLRERADGATVAVGFDFPIGVPWEYARRAGITDFLELLPKLGRGAWPDFYTVASTPQDIGPTRPFYPMRPGGTRQRHLTERLGVESMTDLLRLCERPTESRGAASPLFWTMGGKQVGKAAIVGWREVLAPALRDPEQPIRIWPFDGDLSDLLGRGGIVVAETYPAEACVHLGLSPPGRGWSKRTKEGRGAQWPRIADWLAPRPIELTSDLSALLADGFGASKDAEDRFDAFLGLLSMVDVVRGALPQGAPGSERVRRVEGWILGRAP